MNGGRTKNKKRREESAAKKDTRGIQASANLRNITRVRIHYITPNYKHFSLPAPLPPHFKMFAMVGHANILQINQSIHLYLSMLISAPPKHGAIVHFGHHHDGERMRGAGANIDDFVTAQHVDGRRTQAVVLRARGVRGWERVRWGENG